MLLSLFLKDFAIAADVEFELGPGMTVISGETGAGKSLLVDALMLLTGSRADAGVVRFGAERSEVSATFRLTDAPAAAAWLSAQEYAVEGNDECQLRRVIRADGGSKAWINGRPATMGQLGALGQSLVEIHGQHEHQALLQRTLQLDLLDAFGGHDAPLERVTGLHARWRTCRLALDALPGGEVAIERIAECERLLAQLDAESLAPQAVVELLAAHRRQSNVVELMQGCDHTLARLIGDEGPSVSSTLGQSASELRRLANHEPRLGELIDSLASLQIQVDEAAASIERLRENLDLDPARLDELETTLGRLHELGRRHRLPIERLFEARDALAAELDTLRNADQKRAQLSSELTHLQSEWQRAANTLTASRRDAAARLSGAVSALMQELGMQGGVLAVQIEPSTDAGPDPLGAERVEFLVSANPGQPPRPLRKVASGGELSRISLAIEVASLGADSVPTMVFDEVDSGIGGAVAEVVGRTLRELAGQRQVLCVTHLPQVAACAHAHYRVSKLAEGGQTSSQIEALSAAARIEEVARMLGGVEITAATRELARQMLG